MLTPLRQASARVVGTKRLLRALDAGMVKMAFVASDADPFLTKRVTDRCLNRDIPCLDAATAKEIAVSSPLTVYVGRIRIITQISPT